MESYRSLVAWQLAHSLCVRVLRLTDAPYHARSRQLFDQLKRASISVAANIVEGYALCTDPLFRQHLRIALGSVAEAECLLDVAADVQYLPFDVVDDLRKTTGEAMKVIFGLLRKIGTGSP